MVKYHFITFATPDYISFANKNVQSALTVGGFDTAKIYTMDDIDNFFKMRNAHLLKHKRLGGYAVWKPYIILKHLLSEEVSESDILCYNDSKYIWTVNVRQLEKDILSNKNIGVYKNKPNDFVSHLEKMWTKGDAYLLMNMPIDPDKLNAIKNTHQAWSGFILLRKSFSPIRFISEWLTYNQDSRIATDSPSFLIANDESFEENRHDQTILSLLCKKWGIYMNFLDKNYMIDIRNPLTK